MKCFVSTCKNDSRRITKAAQGITFHVFPADPIARTAWLEALGQKSSQPKITSVVCSLHFTSEDLYEDKCGRRKVRTGAVPLVLKKFKSAVKCDTKAVSCLQACRICLAVDIKLLPLTSSKLKLAYEKLTGVNVCEDALLPQRVCLECARRLNNCTELCEKSLRANLLLLDIVRTQNALTLSHIKGINREAHLLSSPFSVKSYEANHFDVYIEESTEYLKPQTIECIENTTDDTTLPVIKEEENDIFIQEDLDVDVKNDNQDPSDVDLKSDNRDTSDIDRDYVASDKEYSSDDNVPLERCKKIKKRKQKIIEKSNVKKYKIKKKLKEDPGPKIDRRRKPLSDLNDPLFAVTQLTFEEQVAEILKRRDGSNYKNSVFKCESCFKGFLDEDAYNSHMVRHTDQCGEYECEICKTHFKQSNALRKHITAHHTTRYSCRQCPYVTTHRQTARLHVRWHKGTTYECPHCFERFAKFTTYMGHLRIKHPSQFVCDLCGYTFVSAKGIELHKKLKHRLEDSEVPADGPACGACSVRFVSSAALRTHLAVSHHDHATDNRRGRKTNEERELDRAKAQDSGADKKTQHRAQFKKTEGPMDCEQCGVQLANCRAYHSHFRRSHPDKNRTNYPSMKTPCMCEQCGRMFQSYALLKDHRWVHTGERPFKCEECGKAFRMKQRLVAHRRLHSVAKRTYTCELCGKHFSTHSNRQRHMFIHTGLKPFKCEMCGKGFKHASEKRAHVTYVHLKKPWPKRSRGKRHEHTHNTSHPQQHAPSEMDMTTPMWGAYDPKLAEVTTATIHKPEYCNMKI